MKNGNTSTMNGSKPSRWIKLLTPARDASIFFIILSWIIILVLLKRKIINPGITFKFILFIIGMNLLIILISPILNPLYKLILKGTQKLGSFIFSLITAVVFIFILTPISLFKRLRGHKVIETGYRKDLPTYYRDYEPSKDIEKQY